MTHVDVVYSLKTKINQNYILKFSLYHAGNTLPLGKLLRSFTFAQEFTQTQKCIVWTESRIFIL